MTFSTMQSTSLSTYYREIEPNLGLKQKVVLDEIKRHRNITNTELAHNLNLPINTITPRVKELRTLGKVQDAGKRPCTRTGRTAYAWQEVRKTLF